MSTATTASPIQCEPELRGQTVVVIGGSAGIGLETARRARAEGASAVERAGVRQEECGGIHRVGKRGLSVCGWSHATNLTFDFGERIVGKNMANLKFDKEITALLVIDPYNDFISEGGKVWNRLKGVAEANKCIPHMMQVLAELGYEVTMVKDATADYSDKEMHAALDVNIPNYATAIVTTKEVVDSISSL
jgi:hypothetical protein